MHAPVSIAATAATEIGHYSGRNGPSPTRKLQVERTHFSVALDKLVSPCLDHESFQSLQPWMHSRHSRHSHIVLAIAMISSAVKVSLVMIPLSNSMFTKMIIISALVCSSHPMTEASPGPRFKILPAIRPPNQIAGSAGQLVTSRRSMPFV